MFRMKNCKGSVIRQRNKHFFRVLKMFRKTVNFRLRKGTNHTEVLSKQNCYLNSIIESQLKGCFL